MRIALCADGRSPHTQRWANELARRGHDLTVVWQAHHADLAVLEEYADQVQHVACRRCDGRRDRGAAELEHIPASKLRTRLSPDLVQGMYLVESGWTAARVGRPLVQFALGSDVKALSPERSANPRRRLGDAYRRRRTTGAVRAADAVLCDSTRIRDAIRARVPGTRVELVRIGVEVSEPGSRRDWRMELGIARNATVLLSTRLFTPNYNLATIIRAMSRVLESLPEAILVLKDLPRLSDPEYRAQCQRLIGELEIEHAVRWVDELDRPDLLALYRTADVYLSVPASDATAVSVLEAMSSGVPVVASWTEGIDPQILEDGRTALLVPPGEVQQLADAILRLHSTPQLGRALVEQAGAVVDAVADIEREFDKVEGLYSELVQRA